MPLVKTRELNPCGLMIYMPARRLREFAGRFFDDPERFDNCPVTDFAASDFTEFLD